MNYSLTNIQHAQISQTKINPWKPSLLSIAIVSVLGLSACGGGGGDSGSTPIPTPPPARDNPPVVSVDERIIVSAGDAVSLTATASDPDGDSITYSWTQVTGEAVTNTNGFDSATASFSAPDEVGTFRFEVSARANGASDTASILVMVLEDVDTAVFIDAEFTGTSDGSIDAPFTELASVLQQSIDDNQDTDFYIKTPSDDTMFQLWENSASNINQNISFYGGYLADWQRDEVNNRTPVITDNPRGMHYFNTSEYIEVSGLDLLLDLQNINVNDNPIAISGNNLVALMVRNNTIEIADHPFDNSSGTLYGVYADTVASFSLIGNDITTGAAPTSARNASNNNTGDGDIGSDGGNADDDDGGNGAGAGIVKGGGDGGNGGNGSSEAGNAGANGGRGGNGGSAGGAGNDGTDGQDGNNGVDGNTGTGGSGFGRFTNGGRFAVSSGSPGGKGADGYGGGGGGGGGSSFLGFNGGGGGGGGEGGEGGNGGFGASSGGASIAVYVVGGTLNDIKDNTITSGNGGIGGIGGLGAQGGAGGSGGSGEDGNSSNSGNGGDGGAGGTGGDGGIGASGGGGPSFGIVLNPDTFATISNNQITTGDGGNGGSAIIAREQAAGKGGWSIGIYDADPTDASTPTLEGNTFTLGQAGADGNPSSGTGTAAGQNF